MGDNLDFINIKEIKQQYAMRTEQELEKEIEIILAKLMKYADINNPTSKDFLKIAVMYVQMSVINELFTKKEILN